jgi:DHA1 family multidrug resistance protein B-like MFS transporter
MKRGDFSVEFSKLHPNIKIRIFVQILTGSVGSMIFPFLPIYFASRLGESLTGLLLIGTVCASAVGNFLGGYISDRVGRRQMMILSEGLIVLSLIVLAYYNRPGLDHPYITYTCLWIDMFCAGLFSPSLQAMILDITTPDERKTVFRINYWISNLTLAIGGLTGAFFFKTHRFELFCTMTAMSLFSLLITLFVLQETHRPEQKSEAKGNILTNYRNVLRDHTFLYYITASILILALERQLQNYIGVRLERELSPQPLLPGLSFDVDGMKMLGFLRTENTLLVVLLAAIVARYSKRLTDRTGLIVGILLLTVGTCVLTVSNSPWLLFLFMLVLTLGELVYIPIKQTALGDIAPAHARSSYMAVNSLSYTIATMLGAFGVTLGSLLSSWAMSLLYLLLGLTGLSLFLKILPDLTNRRLAAEQTTAPISA